MPQLVSVALFFGAIQSCLASRAQGAQEATKSGDTSSDCSHGWEVLCHDTMWDTSTILMAAMDQNATIAAADAIVDSLLPDFCELVLSRGVFLQCSNISCMEAINTSEAYKTAINKNEAYNELQNICGNRGMNSKSMHEKCMDKTNTPEAYDKTDFVDDLENLCWARLDKEVYNNISWSEWGDQAAEELLWYYGYYGGISLPEWTDMLELFDIEEEDDDISVNESCLMFQGDESFITFGQGSTSAPPNSNLGSWEVAYLWSKAMLTSLKCNLGWAASVANTIA